MHTSTRLAILENIKRFNLNYTSSENVSGILFVVLGAIYEIIITFLTYQIYI